MFNVSYFVAFTVFIVSKESVKTLVNSYVNSYFNDVLIELLTYRYSIYIEQDQYIVYFSTIANVLQPNASVSLNA